VSVLLTENYELKKISLHTVNDVHLLQFLCVFKMVFDFNLKFIYLLT